ncbi:hypothetical protein VRU48_04750 [Pedobacter sp. KR3-3]|uniref:Uncharacterized protein n=1 Tax=Pedobacter albus TaxID=3113905 RepID=A0ABU7I4L8_9SPHI|nr:hypothetical protein [Pedobacter sp. KR3-3]MEE1944405.1 hypothetical protein [Pedobacter sp. KR3-3]
MENNTSNHTEDPNKTAPPIETNYGAHKENPGPAPTVNEPDNEGAGQAMKWIIPIVVLILLVIWFIFFRDNVTK